MAQFDVYTNQNRGTRNEVPYLLDIQTDLLADLATRAVVPLIHTSVMGKPARYLNPEFTIENSRVVMSTAELAGVPVGVLGGRVCSLADHRSEIIAALDFLITGF